MRDRSSTFAADVLKRMQSGGLSRFRNTTQRYLAPLGAVHELLVGAGMSDAEWRGWIREINANRKSHVHLAPPRGVQGLSTAVPEVYAGAATSGYIVLTPSGSNSGGHDK
jgi:hypothetical protein